MGSQIENMFSGGQSQGYGDIQKYLQQGTQQMQGDYNQGQAYLNPYNQAGQSAIPDIQKFLGGIPGQMNGNWMQGYNESPYAKYMTNKSLNAMNNAAAATGQLGTAPNQQSNADTANSIASQDAQNYFNNNMAQSNQYLGGLGDLARGGLSAAQSQGQLSAEEAKAIADMYGQMGAAKGNEDMAKQGGKNSGIGNLLGSIGSFF